ncbi:MAG: hypothetical protein ACYTG0_18815 [Planctomycetota bacterium]|jgi:hypothetical protein
MVSAAVPSVLDAAEGELVLQILGTERHGQLVRLKSEKCTIGAAPRCTLRLRARAVQPVHCLILRGSAGVVIRCLAPDTRLNGRAFGDAPLLPGDRLSVGPIEFAVLDSHSVLPSDFELGRSSGASSLPTEPVDRRELNDLTARRTLADRQARDRARRLLRQLRSARQRIARLEAKQQNRPDAKPSPCDPAQLDSTQADARQAELDALAAELKRRDETLASRAGSLDEQSQGLDDRERALRALEETLGEREREFGEKEKGLAEKERELSEREETLGQRESDVDESDTSSSQPSDSSQPPEPAERPGTELATDGPESEADRYPQVEGQTDHEPLPNEPVDEVGDRSLESAEPEREPTGQVTEVISPQSAEGQADHEPLPNEPDDEVDDRSLGLAEPEREPQAGQVTEVISPQSEDSSAWRRPEPQPAQADEQEGSTSIPSDSKATPVVWRSPEGQSDSSDDIFRRMGMPGSPSQDPKKRPDSGQRQDSGASSGAGNPDESIDQYMARLLERVRETKAGSTGPSEPEPPSGYARVPPAEPSPPDREDEVPPEPDDSPQEMLKPGEMSPRAVAPEKLVDFNAMRELANFSADSAIRRYARSKLSRAAMGKLLVTVIGSLAALLSFWLWWKWGAGELALYAAGASCVIAILWGIHYAVLTGRIIINKSGRLEWRRKPPGSDRRAAGKGDKPTEDKGLQSPGDHAPEAPPS